jgi:NAD+ kinase
MCIFAAKLHKFSYTDMKIFGYRRSRDYASEDFLRSFLQITDASGFDYRINKSYAERVAAETGIEIPYYTQLTENDLTDGAMLVAIGGDGTFLEAVHSLKGLPMPIAGVNLGRLGFLAGISLHDFKDALEEIKNGNYMVEKRIMLEATGDFGTVPDFPCALNEFYIHRHTADMIEVSMHADGQLVSVARGDGVIVATPTGSTAYSLSAGGPVVSPDCSCFVCSVIAPHNFSTRPLVLPDTTTIEIEVRSRGREVLASLDNHSFTVGDGARFTIKKSQHHTFLAKIQNISFYDTLRDKIMWGLDRRDGSCERIWPDI